MRHGGKEEEDRKKRRKMKVNNERRLRRHGLIAISWSMEFDFNRTAAGAWSRDSNRGASGRRGED